MAGEYNKMFYANIQLINSIIKDEDGNQISLTSDERLSISNASGGPATQANPITTKSYVDSSIEEAVSNAVDGLSWRRPVDTVADTAPTVPIEGMRYINTTDNKIYTYTNEAWDVGVSPEINWAVFVKDTDEEYTYDGDTEEWVMKSSGSLPDATSEVKGKVVIGQNIDVSNGSISVKDGSESYKGVVQLATNGEVSALKVVQSNDSRLLKGRFHQAYTEVTNFEVVHNLNSTKLLVQVWKGGEIVDAYVAKKTGSETTTLNIGINEESDVEVSVIAIP